jgi:hypothetical protein
MKFASVVVILSICLAACIYPQSANYISKYKKYLPEKDTASFLFMQSFNKKITSIAKIDPKLIYLYFRSLGYQSTKDITNKYSDEVKNYNYNRYLSIKQRDKWLHWYYKSKHSIPLTNKVRTVYPEFDEEENPDTLLSNNLQLDSNQVYYFAQLFYSDSENQNMSPGVDYKKMYAQNLKKRVSYYENLFKNASELSEDSLKSLYSQTLQYWYLFDKNYLAEYNISNPIPYNEILFDRYISLYKEHLAVSVGIEVFPVSKMFTRKVDYSYTKFDVAHPFTFEYQFKNLFAAEVKLFIPIKREIAPFSHIELGAGYIFSSTNGQHEDFYSYTGSAPGKYITKGCYANGSAKKHQIFIATLSTPAYYFGRDLYITVGGEIMFRKWDVKSDLVYTEETEYTGSNSKDTKSTIVPLSYSENSNKVLPLLEVHYRFWNGFELLLKYDCTIQTGLRYLLKFGS